MPDPGGQLLKGLVPVMSLGELAKGKLRVGLGGWDEGDPR